MSRRNDIDIRAGVEGVEQTKRGLKGIGDSARKVGTEVDKTGKKTARAGSKMGNAFAGLAGQFSGFIAGFIGIGAVISGAFKAMHVEADSLKQTLDILKGRIEAIKDLQFLGDFAKQNPNAAKQLDTMALRYHMGPQGPVQLAKAYESVVSKMPAATTEQRLGLLQEAAQYTQTTRTDVGTLANLLIFAQKASPGSTPNQLQNLLQLGITEAGSSMEAMAQHLPRVLGLGGASGLSMPETFGLYAGATGVYPQPAEATTGLATMLAALQGKGTPQDAKFRRRTGIKSTMPVMQQLDILSQAAAAGKVSMADYEGLFGREGMKLAANLIPQMPAVRASIANLERYNQPGLDIVGQKVGEYYAPGTPQVGQQVIGDTKLLEDLSRLSPDAINEAQWEEIERNLRSAQLRRAGTPEWQIDLMTRLHGQKGIVPGIPGRQAFTGTPTAQKWVKALLQSPQFTEEERSSVGDSLGMDLRTQEEINAHPQGPSFMKIYSGVHVNYHLDRGQNPAQAGEPNMPYLE